MKKIAFLFLAAFSLSLWSQNVEYDEKLYFSDAEYFFIQEFYVDALSDFMEVYNHGNSENANLNYLIGICYLNIPGQKDKSIEYFLKAAPKVSLDYKKSSLKEEYAPVDLYLYLGNAYRINEQFDEAIEAYEKYKTYIDKGNEAEIDFANKQIQACTNARKNIANPLDIALVNVGEPINNSYANFNPVVTGDGNTMVYMSRLPFYDAILISEKIGGKWTEPRNITPEIQSDGDQYVCDISYDGTYLLLSKEDDMNSDIYISKMDDNGVWNKSQPLEDINTRFWESHASFSKDAKTIYFSSNRPDSKGGMDVYTAEKFTDGSWGNIKHLGETINTILNDDMPFISEDGTKLFFSTQRESCIGGYDIYVSTIDKDGEWSEPQNLGYPLCTSDNNLFYYPHKNGESPYFFRYLEDGFGDYDIMTIQQPGEELPEEPIAMTEEPQVNDNEVTETEQVPLPETEEFTEEPQVEESVAVIEKDKYEIKPVFFDFDKYSLSVEAKKMLDVVADIMLKHPEINIILSGHTDLFGSLEYNIKLSKRRGEAAEKYLASKGVEKTRVKIEAKNGQFQLVETDMSDKNSPRNRLNRRVEFDFHDYDKSKIEINFNFKIPDEYKD